MPDLEIRASGKSADWSDLRKAAEALNVEIAIGFPSGRQHVPTRHDKKRPKKGEGGKNATPVPMETCELARVLHNGSATIPARPFLEDAIRENEETIYKAIEKEINKAVSGKTPNWDSIGVLAVGKVQELVRSNWYKTRAPNAESTIKRKTVNGNVGDQPLIDGADLINSLAYIKKGGYVTLNRKGQAEEHNAESYNSMDFRS